MITPVVIKDQLKGLTVLANRGEHTPEAEVEAAFATLGNGDFRDACLFLGSFDGSGGWERHIKGDELVQILAGSTQFDIIVDDDKQTLQLSEGMLVVVPRGCWHRFRSEGGVTVLTATPRSDEHHTFVDDPRAM